MTKLPKEFFVWSFNDWDNWGGYARTTNLHPLDDKERETGVLCVPRAEADAMVAAAWQAAAEAADALGTMWWAQYKDRKSPHCASTHREGMSDGAADVAEHIRQSTPSDARAAFEQAVREAIAAERERCARIGYRVCAETRHVTLGDKVEAAIRAPQETGE